MAIFRCKSCSGELDVQEGQSVVECEYCGNKQTLPKTADSDIQELFNRANFLRQKCEFDKAEKLYEKILEKNPEEAEAYWGIVLCSFGIEYVKDPGTERRIPTCHRVSYDSVVADDNYKQAIKYADAMQRPVYEADARTIDGIQKRILEISSKEEAYDVFICYKESEDDTKERTQDSVMANDIYYQLTNEGYKVFYAAVTLEGKLGEEYEPIIFSALNSAKVMLVVGSKPEYFQAVWVRNEWSRFLKLMKKDRSRLLIPCYKGMDAYDLPEEFAHLQAQNMGKIGFINDLVRGIKKVIVKDEPKSEPVSYFAPASAPAASASSVAPLLKRAFMFLEDGDFERADDLLEEVLNQDPENAMAYVGKLMVDARARRINDLAVCPTPFDSNINCKKAMRFGDEALQQKLKGFNDSIRQRIASAERARVEAANLEVYNRAMGLKANGVVKSDIKSYLDAKALFEKIKGYRDSDAMAKECQTLANDTAYNSAVAKMKNATTAAQYEDAINALLALNGYKNSAKLVDDCREKIEEVRIEEAYQQACRQMAGYDLSEVDKAQQIFEFLGDYKDSRERAKQCRDKWLKLHEEKRKQDRADAVKAKLGCIIPLLVLIGIIVAIVLGVKGCKAEKQAELDEIRALIDAGEYDQAIEKAEAIDSSDANILYREAIKAKVVKLFNDGDIEKAEELWVEYHENNYGWNDKYAPELRYHQAAAYANAGNYARAYEIYNEDLEYSDTKAKVAALRITARDAALALYDEGKFKEAYDAIKSFKYSEEELDPNMKSIMGYLADGNYAGAVKAGLTNVTLPADMTEITDNAFERCEALESITLPDNLTKIGANAFSGCKNLKSITLSDNLTKIGANAFSGCKNLKSITIPESVTEIGAGAFNGCESLTTVKIPSKVKFIKERVFQSCKGLTSMVIPTTITEIHGDAFLGCTSLKTIEIPDSVTFMEDRVFYGCTSLESITVPFIGEKADGTGATNFGHIFYEIPSSLKTVTVTHATKIAGSAFKNFETLVTLNLPDTITTIGSNAFENCYNLTNFDLPSKVQTIGSSAFLNCYSLNSITVPKTLTGIGNEAFKNCYTLVEIYNLSNLTMTAGAETSDLITKNAKVVHKSETDSSILFREGDYIFMSYGESVYMMGYGGTATSLTLPTTAKGSRYSIYDYAFRADFTLTEVVMSTGVIGVGRSAFNSCDALVTVNMVMSDANRLGLYAFAYCDKLETVKLNSTLSKIGDYAFYDCKALKTIELPVYLNEIGLQAFGGETDLSSAIFAVGTTTGWSYSSKSDGTNATNISSNDLSNSITAATKLDYNLPNYYWKRTVS